MNEKGYTDAYALVGGTKAWKDAGIKGAINIPAEGFATRYAEVPKDKKIIAYCS